MKYCDDADYILKGVNIDILPGEKIGCIGRTGNLFVCFFFIFSIDLCFFFFLCFNLSSLLNH